jgi:hypothetical protein
LNKLEEVLVITQRDERAPAMAQPNMRAADILALRLPSVPDTPAEDPKKAGAPATASGEAKPQSASAAATKPVTPPAKPVPPPKTATPAQEKPQ